MSAVVSRSCVAPLERVKMDLVLSVASGRHSEGLGLGGVPGAALRVLRSEGLRGLWRGNLLNVLRTAPFKAVNFLSFDTYHPLLVAMAGTDGNPQRFVAGAMAGITSTLLCFPLDVLRTRMIAPGATRYGGTFSTLVGMVRNEGASSLYSGIAPALLGMMPAGAVFYGVYDTLKAAHLKRLDTSDPTHAPHTRLGPLPTLLYGAMSGGCSELVVYPLEILRRRMQLMSSTAAASASSRVAMSAAAHAAAGGSAGAAAAAASRALFSRHAALLLATWLHVKAASASIVAANGVSGFYVGLLPNLMQVLPSAALSYLTYDTMKVALGVTT